MGKSSEMHWSKAGFWCTLNDSSSSHIRKACSEWGRKQIGVRTEVRTDSTESYYENMSSKRAFFWNWSEKWINLKLLSCMFLRKWSTVAIQWLNVSCLQKRYISRMPVYTRHSKRLQQCKGSLKMIVQNYIGQRTILLNISSIWVSFLSRKAIKSLCQLTMREYLSQCQHPLPMLLWSDVTYSVLLSPSCCLCSASPFFKTYSVYVAKGTSLTQEQLPSQITSHCYTHQNGFKIFFNIDKTTSFFNLVLRRGWTVSNKTFTKLVWGRYLAWEISIWNGSGLLIL